MANVYFFSANSKLWDMKYRSSGLSACSRRIWLPHFKSHYERAIYPVSPHSPLALYSCIPKLVPHLGGEGKFMLGWVTSRNKYMMLTGAAPVFELSVRAN